MDTLLRTVQNYHDKMTKPFNWITNRRKLRIAKMIKDDITREVNGQKLALICNHLALSGIILDEYRYQINLYPNDDYSQYNLTIYNIPDRFKLKVSFDINTKTGHCGRFTIRFYDPTQDLQIDCDNELNPQAHNIICNILDDFMYIHTIEYLKK